MAGWRIAKLKYAQSVDAIMSGEGAYLFGGRWNSRGTRMVCWRIAKLKYAQSIDDMMSGEGAYLFGGRWNSRGTRMVYLGSSIAQAAYEILVHTNRSSLIRSYSKLSGELESFSVDLLDMFTGSNQSV